MAADFGSGFLEAALVEGLAEGGSMAWPAGADLDVRLAAATLGVDGGLMVTGSHNPPDHNGFKMVLLGKAAGEAIQRLAQTVDTLGPPSNTRGLVTERTVFSDYLDRVQHDYDGAKPMKVARGLWAMRPLKDAIPGVDEACLLGASPC